MLQFVNRMLNNCDLQCSAAAVKELLDLGFRTTIRDGEGRSPLHYAAKHGCLEVYNVE